MQPARSTFETVADLLSEICDIPREDIVPESHVMNDLEVDSLDFLDTVFAIDKEFGIKVPVEEWTEEVNANEASSDEYFVLGRLCERIDELRARAAASDA